MNYLDRQTTQMAPPCRGVGMRHKESAAAWTGGTQGTIVIVLVSEERRRTRYCIPKYLLKYQPAAKPKPEWEQFIH